MNQYRHVLTHCVRVPPKAESRFATIPIIEEHDMFLNRS